MEYDDEDQGLLSAITEQSFIAATTSSSGSWIQTPSATPAMSPQRSLPAASTNMFDFAVVARSPGVPLVANTSTTTTETSYYDNDDPRTALRRRVPVPSQTTVDDDTTAPTTTRTTLQLPLLQLLLRHM